MEKENYGWGFNPKKGIIMDKVKLTITACDQCPNMKADRYYTADSFEMVYEWKCKASKDKSIAIQDWSDKAPPIPKWCPLRTK